MRKSIFKKGLGSGKQGRKNAESRKSHFQETQKKKLENKSLTKFREIKMIWKENVVNIHMKRLSWRNFLLKKISV